MKFEDLSNYDITLIQSMSVNLLLTTKLTSRYEAITDVVLSCIYSKGFKFTPYPNNLLILISKDLETTHHLRQSLEVIKGVFTYLEKNGILIEKDLRDSTWSEPKSSWYSEYQPNKKSWVI